MIDLLERDSVASWHLTEDDEGWRKLEISFMSGVGDSSLLWQICNELFGFSHWRVVTDEMKRDVEITPERVRLGAWSHNYVVERA